MRHFKKILYNLSILFCFNLFCHYPLMAQDSKQINQTNPTPKLNKQIHQYLNKLGQSLSENNKIRYETAFKMPTHMKQIAHCEHTPTLSLPTTFSNRTNFQRFSIKLTCQRPKQWSTYIKASIEFYGPAVVANASIARGTRIQSTHLSVKEINLNRQYRGYYSDIRQLINSKARFPIKKQQIISPHQVSATMLVNKGDQVTIQVRSNLFSITTSGIALSSGQLGEQIDVENSTSKQAIKAVILDKGLVSVH